MADLKAINAKCYDVFKFCYGICDRLYAPELSQSEQERINNLKKELELAILDILEDDYQLCQKNEGLYYLQLYIIHFMETYLDERQFIEITNAILLVQDKEPNFLSPLVLILMADRCLKEDIIEKIYTKCEIELLSNFPKLGHAPYDYRYHFLKREETPEGIKSKILASYDEMSLDEMRDFMQSILDELNSELRRNKITDINQVTRFPSLKIEYHFFEIMKDYYHNRVKKEKRV